MRNLLWDAPVFFAHKSPARALTSFSLSHVEFIAAAIVHKVRQSQHTHLLFRAGVCVQCEVASLTLSGKRKHHQPANRPTFVYRKPRDMTHTTIVYLRAWVCSPAFFRGKKMHKRLYCFMLLYSLATRVGGYCIIKLAHFDYFIHDAMRESRSPPFASHIAGCVGRLASSSGNSNAWLLSSAAAMLHCLAHWYGFCSTL